MARTDHSSYGGDARRSQGAPPSSSGRSGNRSAARRSSSGVGSRHNPLRDEYPRSRDRDYYREPEPDRRHSGDGRGTQQRSRSQGGSHRAAPRQGRAAHSSSPYTPKAFSLSGTVGSLGQLDVRRLGAIVLGSIIVIIFAMALLHVGPFAPTVTKDGSKHVGVQGANAVTSNASYLLQNIAMQMSIARPVEPELAKLPAHTTTREDLSRLSGQSAPFAFAVAEATDENGEAIAAPVLSDRSLVNLNNALTFYDANGYEASYLIMDLGTGRGIAGNIDVPIYGASSFKGPYCAYVVNKEFPNDINSARSSRLGQVENTIVWSDNSSYGKLRRTYGDEGMEEWLEEAGVDTALLDDTYFPTYTARQSALMWLKIHDYLTTADTSAAQWLSDAFARTEVSFLRNGALGTTSAGHTDYLPEEGSGTEEGVEEAETDAEAASDDDDEAVSLSAEEETAPADDGDPIYDEEKTVASIGTNITVRNKAGWIDGKDDDAVCDSGIVTINGRDYLMVIMTNAPDSADGEQAFAHLARTLLEIRGDLV